MKPMRKQDTGKWNFLMSRPTMPKTSRHHTSNMRPLRVA